MSSTQRSIEQNCFTLGTTTSDDLNRKAFLVVFIRRPELCWLNFLILEQSVSAYSNDEPVDPFSNNHTFCAIQLRLHPGTRPFSAPVSPEALRGEWQDPLLAKAYSFGMINDGMFGSLWMSSLRFRGTCLMIVICSKRPVEGQSCWTIWAALALEMSPVQLAYHDHIY